MKKNIMNFMIFSCLGIGFSFPVTGFSFIGLSVPPCFGFAVGTSSGFPQNPEIRFDRLSIEQGLSENVILSIVQDSKGFVWIGTQDGLNRYDGNNVKVFRNDPENPESLSNSYISSLCLDRSGNLWVGTARGLNRFDMELERFIRYYNAPENSNSLSSNNVRAIYSDRAGYLWIGTDNGLNRLNRSSGNIIRYQNRADNLRSISHNQISAIYEDKTGYLWVGTLGGGLNRLDRQTDEFNCYKPDTDNPESISHINITAIHEDRSGNLWIGTEGGGLDRLNRQTGQFFHYRQESNESAKLWKNLIAHKSISHNNIAAIHEDRTGALWITTTGGGINLLQQETSRNNKLESYTTGQKMSHPDAFKPETVRFIHYHNEPDNPQSLSTDMDSVIMEDDSGILWFGTDDGISRFDRSKQKFDHYRHSPGNPDGLSNKTVPAILKDSSGILWIGTSGGGLNMFDALNNRFIHYIHDPANPDSISDDTIYSIYEDRSKNLWIGTQNGGLNKFDRESKTFIHYRACSKKGGDSDKGDGSGKSDTSCKSGPSSDFIYPIHEDSSGILWIGTWGGGLNRFNPETGQFVHYRHDSANPESLSNDILSSIVEDKDGKLWIGTFQGLNSLDPKTGLFTHYFHNDNDPQSLSNNTAVSIYIDRSGTLWVGTLGGLNRFDRERKTFRRYGEKDGLPNSVIASIMEDKKGMLWLGTFNGISKFDPYKETFRNYKVADGLQSRRFRANSNFQAEDGQMFFGGINGFNAFYPEKIKDSTYIPRVVLTDFQLFNQSVKPQSHEQSVKASSHAPLYKSITESEQIELSWKDAVFSFEFAALDFSAPESIKYGYKLEGFDKEWRYTNAKKRFATYTNLDGGIYTFRVKATNSDNIWNEKDTSIKVIIRPPFWKTSWFYCLVAVVLILIIALTITYLLKLKFEIEERKRAEKENEKLQHQLLQAQKMESIGRLAGGVAHDFNNMLGVIIGHAEILLDTVDETEPIHEGLSAIRKAAQRSAALTKQLLAFARKQIITPQAINLNDAVEGMLSMLERLIGENIELIWIPDHNIAKVMIDPAQIDQIMANLCINARDAIQDMGKITIETHNAVFDAACGLAHLDKNTSSSVDAYGNTNTTSPTDAYGISRPSHADDIYRSANPEAPPGVYVMLAVSDNGCGMDRETMSHIFDPFFTTKEMNKGTGLGLASVYGSVRQNNGFINVYSEPGEGTTFRIYLPVYEEPKNIHRAETCNESGIVEQSGIADAEIVEQYGTSEEPETDAESKIFEELKITKKTGSVQECEIPRGSETILLVEDEDWLLELGQTMLERLGYTVLTASTPKEAINITTQYPTRYTKEDEYTEQIDLLITDVIMPEMNGWELSTRLRKINPDLRCLFMSGYTANVIAHHGVLDPGVNFIQKPFSIQDLAQKVRASLNK